MKPLISWISISFTALAFWGCAAVAPSVLVDARNSYDAASSGAAASTTPTELYDANKVLQQANREFADNGDTPKLRDLCYITTRKVELVNVKTRIALNQQHIADVTRQGIVERDRQAVAAREALQNTRDQLNKERTQDAISTNNLEAQNNAQDRALADTNAQLMDQKTQLQNDQTQLEAERNARQVAEGRLARAMNDLATVAKIKEEARGLVITLNGSVLFAFGKFDLLPTATARLDQVAQALMDEPADRKMVVEGHTDNRGSDAVNVPLSLSRASSVRDYLVSRGIDANRISAVGLGSSRPLVDNSSAENRANNRRVEIIVQNPSLSSL